MLDDLQSAGRSRFCPVLGMYRALPAWASPIPVRLRSAIPQLVDPSHAVNSVRAGYDNEHHYTGGKPHLYNPLPICAEPIAQAPGSPCRARRRGIAPPAAARVEAGWDRRIGPSRQCESRHLTAFISCSGFPLRSQPGCRSRLLTRASAARPRLDVNSVSRAEQA